MKHTRPLKTLSITLCLLVAPAAFALPKPQVPQGWTASQQQESWVLKPQGLDKSQVFQLQVFPVTPLKGRDLQEWATAFIQKDAAKRGKVIHALQFQEQQGILVGSLGVMWGNQPVVLIYMLVSPTEGEVQALLMASSPDDALREKYGDVFSTLLAGALKGSGTVQQAQQNQSEPAASSSATGDFSLPAGAKLGGKVEHGTYQCKKPLSDGEVRSFALSLYDNGEYRIGKDDTGKFTADAKKGLINIDSSYDLYNSPYEETDFAIYYRDRNNKPVIYAENDYGLGIWKTTCTYAGKNTSPSPSAETAQKKQQQEEKERFKWVTKPGKGVQMNQIDSLVVHHVQTYDPNTMLTLPVPHLVLLLKDGTAYLGLRVPPEDLDLKASRKNEPGQWTKWKKNGKQLMLLEKNTWKGYNADPVFPAQKGETLKGEFKHMSSTYNFVYGGSTSTTYVTFDPKGKYEISKSSLYSTGNLQSNNGENLSSSSSIDKEGSSGSTGYAGGQVNGSGPTVVTSVQQKDNTPNKDLAGTYTLNGYTLQLKRLDGKIERKLFFFFDKKKQDFWIEDSSYYPSNRYD